MKHIFSSRILGSVALSIFVAVVLFTGTNSAFAAVTVTTATGGGAISADTNTTNGTATWTTLTGPTIAEGAHRDFPGSGTFILNVPSGFSFNTGHVVSSTITVIAGSSSCFSFTSTTATPATSTITFTLNAQDGNGGSGTHKMPSRIFEYSGSSDRGYAACVGQYNKIGYRDGLWHHKRNYQPRYIDRGCGCKK